MKDEEKIYGEDGKMPLKNDLKDQEKEGADLPSPEKSGEEEEKRRPAAAETAVSQRAGNKEELALELERLFAENQSLSAQLTALRKEQEAAAEKAEGLAFLEEMAGGRNTELYEKALKKAEESEELQGLPYKKRYEMSCLLLLGEERRNNPDGIYGTAGFPVFARSQGSGSFPSVEVKEPKTFASAKENAKKYFGI